MIKGRLLFAGVLFPVKVRCQRSTRGYGQPDLFIGCDSRLSYPEVRGPIDRTYGSKQLPIMPV